MKNQWLHHGALIAAVALVAPTPIAAQEVTPGRDRAAVQNLPLDAPRTTEGIESIETLGTTPLGIDAAEVDRYVLRARVVTVAPGGQVGVHRHEGRPGVAYVLEGEMVEYRGEGEGSGVTRRPGDAAFESAGVIHWWRNESDAPARVLVVDALPENLIE